MSLYHPQEEELSALVDGELAGRRRRVVATHVMTCPDCSRVCGELLAARRSVEAPEVAICLPERAWSCISEALDRVDSVGKAIAPTVPRPTRFRLPTLAAAGLLLIAATWAWQNAVLAPARNIEALSRAHDRAAVAALYDGSRVGYAPPDQDAVTPDGPAIGSGVFPFDGGIAEQIVWQVGQLTVSEFSLPLKALRAEQMREVVGWGGPFYVTTTERGSLVAWRVCNRWDALVAYTSPEELLQLARLRTSAPRLP